MAAELASLGLGVEASSHDSNTTQAVTVLTQAYFAYVWRLLRRVGLGDVDAEDVTQQVFLIATRKLRDIRPGSERAFLYRVAIREAGKHRRARGRRREDLTGETDLMQSEHSELDVAFDQRRARELLDGILQTMSMELRVVFVLSEIEELTMREIADVVVLPAGTVASRLRRAREDFDERVARIEAQRAFRRRGS